MERRTHESPMDFEWQTSGPADPTSPFHQVAENYRQKHGQKRTHSIFASPAKSPAAHPPSQPFLFSPPSPTKSFPALPKPSFTTPRKFDLDLCSSGPDISSPEHADGEDTPDAVVRTKLLESDGVSSKTSETGVNDKAERRGSLFGFYRKLNNLSPGRGEVRRGAVAHKVRKRRRNELGDRDNSRLISQRSGYDSGSDSASGVQIIKTQHPRSQSLPSSSSSSSSSSPASMLATLFTWLEAHPHLPHILSYYAQLLLNVFLVFAFIYIVYSFWSTIRSDVDKQSDLVASETLAEMAACARQFVENRCDRATRVPAMETVCNGWERCMNKDPNSVGRARVSAHTFAEIFNSFVEPISYKAMIFFVTLVFGCIAISNLAFGLFRAKATSPPPPTRASYVPQPFQQQSRDQPGLEPFYGHYTPHAQPNTRDPASSALMQTPSRGQIAFH